MHDVCDRFLFNAILVACKSGFKRELHRKDASFNSGVPCPIDDERLSIAVTFLPKDMAKLNLDWTMN